MIPSGLEPGSKLIFTHKMSPANVHKTRQHTKYKFSFKKEPGHTFHSFTLSETSLMWTLGEILQYRSELLLEYEADIG